MQEEIEQIIKKHRGELPDWVAQFELTEVINRYLDVNLGSICKALRQMMKFHEIEFKRIDCNCFKITLKKVGRLDLLNQKNKFRRGSYIYKIS